MTPAPNEKVSVSVEDALDEWWSEDHFGEKCHEECHSEECVSSAFNDGYAAGHAKASKEIADLRAQKEALGLAYCEADERASNAHSALADRDAQIAEMRAKVIAAIPMNWVDPILTGPTAAFSIEAPATTNVEAVLRAVRERIAELLTKESK